MVQEFPELQGIVGGLYAAARGEAQPVADAIYDHYLPQGWEDSAPRTIIGGLVSLVDKIDSVVANFAVGHVPSGSSDPFTLRRQANSGIKLLLEYNLDISLIWLAHTCLELLKRFGPGERIADRLNVPMLHEFLQDRLRYYLETVRGFRYDTVRAVLAAGWDRPVNVLRRAEALEAMRGSPDLEALSVAAKRIKNILAKSATAQDWEPGDVDEEALVEEAETELYRAYRGVVETTKEMAAGGRYQEALARIATLRPVVDRFFDKVLVMAEDTHFRRNRLRLLIKLDDLFSWLAKFAEIVAQPAHVGASTSET